MIAYVPSMLDLHTKVGVLRPDVIIIPMDSPDRDILEDLCVMSGDEPRPVVMFTHDVDSWTAAPHAAGVPDRHRSIEDMYGALLVGTALLRRGSFASASLC